MVYYHIRIKHKSDAELLFAYELNLADTRVESICSQYLKKEDLFFDGKNIYYRRINEIKIFSSDNKIDFTSDTLKKTYLCGYDYEGFNDVTFLFIQKNIDTEHKNITYSIDYEEQYNNIKSELDIYKKKSRIYRYLLKIANITLWIFILQIFLIGIFRMEPSYNSNQPFNYYFTIVFGIIFFVAPIFYLVGKFFTSRIKKECNYEDIKIEFIYVHDSLVSLKKYTNTKSIIHIKNSVNYINKLYNYIEDWDINLPILKYDEKNILKFIKNDFKRILIKYIKSEKMEDKETAQRYLSDFETTLLTGELGSLINIYNETVEFRKIKYTILTEIKIILNNFVKKNKALSQIIFSVFFTLLIYFIGIFFKMSSDSMAGILITVAFSSSFIVFKWIVEDVLEIK